MVIIIAPDMHSWWRQEKWIKWTVDIIRDGDFHLVCTNTLHRVSSMCFYSTYLSFRCFRPCTSVFILLLPLGTGLYVELETGHFLKVGHRPAQSDLLLHTPELARKSLKNAIIPVTQIHLRKIVRNAAEFPAKLYSWMMTYFAKKFISTFHECLEKKCLSCNVCTFVFEWLSQLAENLDSSHNCIVIPGVRLQFICSVSTLNKCT